MPPCPFDKSRFLFQKSNIAAATYSQYFYHNSWWEKLHSLPKYHSMFYPDWNPERNVPSGALWPVLSSLHFAVRSLLFPIYSLKFTHIKYLPSVVTRSLGRKNGTIFMSTFLRGRKPDSRVYFKVKSDKNIQNRSLFCLKLSSNSKEQINVFWPRGMYLSAFDSLRMGILMLHRFPE